MRESLKGSARWHRTAAGVAVLAVAAVVAPTMALSATGSTTASVNVNSVLSLTAPASISFGSVAYDSMSASVATPVVVTSNAAKGYQLSVQRTAFSNAGGGLAGDNVDIPLVVANPSGAGVAPGSTTPAASDVPIRTSATSLLGSGNAGHVTSVSGDTWNLGLVLGPVPFTQDGARSSTVTFTAVTTP